MRISARVNQLQESSTLAVSAKARALKAQGVDVIGFGAGEPDFATPLNICHAAKQALDAGMTHYMPVAGEIGARHAIARKLREDNLLSSITSGANVIISPGGKNAFYLLMHTLFDPGDSGELILPTPAWVSYRPIAQMAGARIVEVPLTVRSDFKMSPDALRQALTPDSRALLINSPSNPCGTMYTSAELQALAMVIRQHNAAHHEPVIVVSDEIYEKLVYGSVPFTSICQYLDPAESVVINGLSKAYAMTGWRIGYTAGPVELIDAMTRLQGQMTTCIAAFFYPAIIEAIENGAPAIEAMRQTYARRAEVIYSLVGQWPGVYCPKPTGAFYIFPDISACFGGTSRGGRSITNCLEFASALLDEEHVAVVPGDEFGGCGLNHIRLSFCCAEEQIRKGMERIGRFLSGIRR